MEIKTRISRHTTNTHTHTHTYIYIYMYIYTQMYKNTFICLICPGQVYLQITWTHKKPHIQKPNTSWTHVKIYRSRARCWSPVFLPYLKTLYCTTLNSTFRHQKKYFPCQLSTTQNPRDSNLEQNRWNQRCTRQECELGLRHHPLWL
jgi:hypothetical protein